MPQSADDEPSAGAVLADALMEALGPENSLAPEGWALPPLYRSEAQQAAGAIIEALWDAGYHIMPR